MYQPGQLRDCIVHFYRLLQMQSRWNHHPPSRFFLFPNFRKWNFRGTVLYNAVMELHTACVLDSPLLNDQGKQTCPCGHFVFYLGESYNKQTWYLNSISPITPAISKNQLSPSRPLKFPHFACLPEHLLPTPLKLWIYSYSAFFVSSPFMLKIP